MIGIFINTGQLNHDTNTLSMFIPAAQRKLAAGVFYSG